MRVSEEVRERVNVAEGGDGGGGGDGDAVGSLFYQIWTLGSA